MATRNWKELYKQFNTFTRRLGNKPLESGRIFKNLPSIETKYGNRPVRIALIEKSGENKPIYATFEMNFTNGTYFEMALRKQSSAALRDSRIGDLAFDRSFIVDTNNQNAFRTLFQEGLRKTLLGLVSDQSFFLSLKNDTIYFERIGTFQSERFNNAFLQMLNVATLLAERCENNSSLLRTENGMIADTNGSDDHLWPDDDLYLNRMVNDLFGSKVSKKGDSSYYTDSFGKHRVELEYTFTFQSRILTIRIPLTQKFWLRLVQQTGDDQEEEVRLSNEIMDQRFRIYSNQRDSAASFLNAPSVHPILNRLPGFDRLEIYRGELTLTIFNPLKKNFRRQTYKQTLVELIQLITIYQDQQLMLSIAPLKSSSNVCPFCREDLANEKETVVTCKRCNTPHHQTCLSENKQCTTWGCFASEADFS